MHVPCSFGLHDLGNTTADLSTYTQQLTAIADRLVQTKSKLLYLMTTPMSECIVYHVQVAAVWSSGH
jgi:hypothetical protein